VEALRNEQQQCNSHLKRLQEQLNEVQAEINHLNEQQNMIERDKDQILACKKVIQEAMMSYQKLMSRQGKFEI
jgi:chromosome segregation ATPase